MRLSDGGRYFLLIVLKTLDFCDIGTKKINSRRTKTEGTLPFAAEVDRFSSTVVITLLEITVALRLSDKFSWQGPFTRGDAT